MTSINTPSTSKTTLSLPRRVVCHETRLCLALMENKGTTLIYKMERGKDQKEEQGKEDQDPHSNIPPATVIRTSLSSARQRNGLLLGEKTMTTNVKFIRTLYRRGVIDSDVLQSPIQLRDRFLSEFRAPSTRCVYARTLQMYLACTADQWPSVDLPETLKALQMLIKDSNAQGQR